MKTPRAASAAGSLAQRQPKACVLAATPYSADHTELGFIMEGSDWELECVPTARAAMDFIARNPVAIVICERDLPDSDWRGLFSAASRLERPPAMIVISRVADDRLWMEVLNFGGFDLLAKPFDGGEVLRSIEAAHCEWAGIARKGSLAVVASHPAALARHA